MNNRFQRKLQRQISIFTMLLIIVSIVLFSGALFFYVERSNSKKLDSASDRLYSFMDSTYKTYTEHLKKVQSNTNYVNYLLSEEEDKENLKSKVYQTLYSFNVSYAKNDKTFDFVKSNLTLSDSSKKIVFHTFSDPKISNQLQEFNNVINGRVSKEEPIQTGAIKLYNGVDLFMMSTGIYQKDVLLGYASYYLNKDDFNYQIANQQIDGVITDRFGDVIACSNTKFLSGALNRVNEAYKEPYFKLANSNTAYISKKITYSEQGISIQTFAMVEETKGLLLLGVIIILTMGAALLFIAKYFSKQLSYKMSNSVTLLCEEIDAIKKGDLDHHVRVHTNDEFEIIADNIDEMIGQIKVLTARNAELHYVSKVSEMKQLEAQFNPHFLYNTLETIRYSILMDDGIASDMIIKLTKILRYSINGEIDMVRFEDDLFYINQFLSIQKYRFKERFTYAIDISEDCKTMMVPKLIIQPILENSIANGFKHKSTLHISIKGRIYEHTMKIWIEDDGIGIRPEELATLRKSIASAHNDSNHLGLFNTNRRLFLSFGEGSGLEIQSEYSKRTTVIITMVLREGEYNV
ncbi:MAG: histidine kinase [Longicatena sp.]